MQKNEHSSYVSLIAEPSRPGKKNNYSPLEA